MSAPERSRDGLREFHARRERGQRALLDADHLGIKRLLRLDAAAYEDATPDGGLDPRTKELLGLVASAVLRCDDCITYHVEQAARQGWTRREIVEALNVALIIGGTIVIPHARRAMLVLDEVFDQLGQEETRQ